MRHNSHDVHCRFDGSRIKLVGAINNQVYVLVAAIMRYIVVAIGTMPVTETNVMLLKANLAKSILIYTSLINQ